VRDQVDEHVEGLRLQRDLDALSAQLEQRGVQLEVVEAVERGHVIECATPAAHGVLLVTSGPLGVLGVPVTVDEPVGVVVAVTVGVRDGDGVVDVTVGVGFLVGFFV
jgi:vacuolar-type H+-ATPase subunit E/Vma4